MNIIIIIIILLFLQLLLFYVHYMLGYIIQLYVEHQTTGFFFLHQENSVCHFFGKNISLSGVKVLQIVFCSHNTKLILLPNFREISILQNKYTL